MHASETRHAVVMNPAALLAIKLAAFYWMLLDHIDWLLGAGQGAHASVGRLVFPMFGFVLAYNLARVEPKRILSELWVRACVCGVIAAIPFYVLQGHVFPLNIMFTLACAMIVYALTIRGEYLSAFALFAVAGIFVDYAWPGIAGVVLLAILFRDQVAPWRIWMAFAGFALALTWINGNVWALLAVPLVMAASAIGPAHVPRMKWLFWIGYPAHLFVLAMLQRWA